MTTATRSSLMHEVDRIAPILAEHADEAERERRLSRQAFEAMVHAGLYQMFVPQELGGLETPLHEGLEVVERISQIDSAAGWNLEISAVGATIGALFPDEGAREIFSDPTAVGAGGFNPPGTAVEVEGGYRLNGRWSFASGCLQAKWLIDTALLIRDGQPQMGPDGNPLLMALVYHADEGKIVDTWHPLGMRGTGSNDLIAEDVFVPARRAAFLRPFDNPGSAYRGPLAKLGTLPVGLGNSVVALGVARAAIDEAVEISTTREPAFMQSKPVTRGVVHTQLAQAEAGLRSARAYFYESIDDAWESALSGSRPSIPQRMHLQLAAAQAASAAATAVDLVQQVVGSAGMREDRYRFARHFRDVHTINQHAFCSGARFESMGRVMLGLESDWPFFYL